ncbi:MULTISPECIES: TolC family protein [Mesoflavibacter]|uniref:TolC family protein n=1 Tax=Mesoflavibacter profundi TaxID=2708110 RepID=A0ABT4S2Q6_9FLAO|nr:MULTISPECIES: TolC family protein [Mesoflavibacter]MDA0178306.1 TolC family protein [Mesoflavibacter profundi]QIJ89268.1 putative outer membrane efflux protein [Mesoflavibacter sp. HG96]QIJ91996.1 putative outer membrane efflux protein [Mesoflavibacter sp. HG37]
MKQIALVVLLFVGFTASAQKKWTLQECVDHALQNNITILQGQNTILSNEQDIKASKGQFLPSVGANLGHTISLGNRELFPGQFVDRTDNSTNASINVSQTVFNGFRLTNLYKQSQLNLETSQLELNRIKDDISLNVVNAYLNVLFNIENLEIAQAQLEFTQKQLDQVKQLVDAGVQPSANIYDAQATLSNDVQNVTVAENNYQLALLTLSQLLQLPFEGFDVEVINLDDPSAELMYDNATPIVSYALQNRNEIKVAQKNIENSKLNTEISKSGFLPSVSFGYGFGSNVFYTNLYDTEDSFFNQLNNQKGHRFTLNVNVPIFSQFQNKTNVAKAEIQEKNALLNLEQTKLNLESNVQRAFTDAKAAFRAYEAAKVSLEAQTIAFQNSQERYNIGAMNAFDLEQTRLRLVNAESSLINAKYDFIFKTKVLDFYLGKPITE